MTVESFMTWKKGFDEERERARARELAEAEARLKGKLTGRQLFMQDTSLIDSDVQFRQAGKQLNLLLPAGLAEVQGGNNYLPNPKLHWRSRPLHRVHKA